MEKKNYNTEWLFNELGNIFNEDRYRFRHLGLSTLTSYFAVMTPEQVEDWTKDYPPYVKDMPGYMFHMFLCKRIDHYKDWWANIIVKFSDELVWRDESGDIRFNNDCHRFAIRYRDTEDGWLTLSNTFDLTDSGIWVCGHTTCHIDAGGGNYSMPACILEHASSFVNMMFEEEGLWEHLTSAAAAQDKDFRNSPKFEVWIVDDTNP